MALDWTKLYLQSHAERAMKGYQLYNPILINLYVVVKIIGMPINCSERGLHSTYGVPPYMQAGKETSILNPRESNPFNDGTFSGISY